MSETSTIPPDAILERIARALKTEIGPAVGDAYPKTQAFMAAVVLQKLAGEIRHAQDHSTDNRADTEALAKDLEQACRGGVPAPVSEAVEALGLEPDTPGLTRVIEALYAHRGDLGATQFDGLLARVRVVLRARIARALEYSA